MKRWEEEQPAGYLHVLCESNDFFADLQAFTQSASPLKAYGMVYPHIKGGIQMGGVVGGVGCGPVGPGAFWTSTGTILVLFILLVIITRSFFL
ncbi:hypothetical protein [Paenibacillus physcomitrellae]|uniref:hypothetical protein n=1 Tax=Paenibacillus physcomitrellae TaxID=1619311 RepID=UPI000B8CDCAB|nr:hypothetical protein [Paenibacillus physcomitrellae]